MTDNNVQVIENFYAALGRGDLSAAFEYLDPAFTLHQAASLPYGGIYRGHAGVQQFFEIFGHTWEQFQSAEVEYYAAGEHVIVRSLIQARPKNSTSELLMPMLQIFHVRDGKALSAHPFYWDTAQLLAVLAE